MAEVGFASTTRSRRLKAVAAASLLPLFLVACPPGADKLPKGPTYAAIDCPYNWGKEIPVGSDSTVWIAGKRTNIPEFHDCQRLFVKNETDSLQHGPLIGLFVSQRIESLDQDLSQAALTVDGQPCIPNPLGLGCTNGPPKVNLEAAGVSVIQAYNFDDQPYGVLGIGPHYNCLYFTLAADGTYEAWMVHTDTVRICPATTRAQLQAAANASPPAAKRLFVRADNTASSSFADYPPVARWEFWEPKQVHYIGVKCGAAWCAVTRPGDGMASKWGAGVSGRDHRLFSIPGWYDEQELAITSDNGTHIKRSRAKGVVVPFPELNERKNIGDYDTTNKDSVYLPGWRVYLEKDISAYHKYGFKKAWPPAPTTKANVVSLMVRNEKWLAQVVSSEDDTTVMEIARHPHESLLAAGQTFLIPGTARWRWIAHDETTWGKCAYGCCSLDP